MIAKVNSHGKGVYGVTLEDYKESIIMRIGDIYGIDDIVLEVFEFAELNGLSIVTNEGVFNTDIKGSGTYHLNKVESFDGTILHQEF